MTMLGEHGPGVTRGTREDIRALPQYEQSGPDCEIDLSSNTNPFGAPPSSIEVVRSAPPSTLSRYPSPYSRALRELIASHVGVTSDEVVVGCGSDNILDAAMRTTARTGDSVALLDPTFVMARIYALTNGLRAVPVPLLAGFDVDAEAMVACGAAVSYLCSPNNPTGNCLRREAVEHVLGLAHGLVVLDEAYVEYSGDSWAPAAPRYDRLLVLRTFSKAFGLAGLRVGYGIGNARLIADIEKVRGPYTVASLSESAAAAAITDDAWWVAERVADTIALRERLISELRSAGRTVFDSRANFVLLPVPDAKATLRSMRDRGIAVRAYTRVPGAGDCIRVSVGLWPQMRRFLESLDACT